MSSATEYVNKGLASVYFSYRCTGRTLVMKYSVANTLDQEVDSHIHLANNRVPPLVAVRFTTLSKDPFVPFS